MKQNVTFTVRRGEGTDETQSIHSAMFHKYVGIFQSQTANLYVMPRTNPLKDGVSNCKSCSDSTVSSVKPVKSFVSLGFQRVGIHKGEEGKRGGLTANHAKIPRTCRRSLSGTLNKDGCDQDQGKITYEHA